MKLKYLWFPVIFLLVTGVSCKFLAYKTYAKKFTISYGSGGGFTGEVKEYLLSGNGKLQLINTLSKDTTDIRTNISKKEIKEIIELSESKAILSTNLDAASNMNSFIRIYKGGNLLKSFQWPKGKMDLPSDLKKLDNLLYQLINNKG